MAVNVSFQTKVVSDGTPALAVVPEEMDLSGGATVTISGMHSTNCAETLEAVLKEQRGVSSAAVSFSGESARITWDPAATTLTEILRGASGLGYGFSPVSRVDARYEDLKQEVRALRSRLGIALLFGTWLVILTLVLHFADDGMFGPAGRRFAQWLAAICALTVVGYSGSFFLRAAWRTLRDGRPGMDFLLCLGALAACVLSFWNMTRGHELLYFISAVLLITLLLTGRLIEQSLRRSSRRIVQTMLREAPAKAAVILQGGAEEKRSVEEIRKGSRVRIRPGERIALDGRVIAGSSRLDTSLVTGEAEPAAVRGGDAICRGALNIDAELLIEVNAAKEERRSDPRPMGKTLAGERPEDTPACLFARHLAPLVLLAAVCAGLFAAYHASEAPEALARALAVLVVACPGALALAGPCAYLMASREAAGRGVVFCSGEVLEQLALVDAVYFDKTGTLTAGPPDDRLREDVIDTLAALRRNGLHPAMVTGDRRAAAQRVAVQVGLGEESVHAEASPEDKVHLLAAAAKRGLTPAYVGDGVNDAPALNAAAAGIAVDTAADPALLSADVVLQQPGIQGVADALEIAVKTRAVIRQNLLLAAGCSLAAASAAAAGHVHPLLAAGGTAIGVFAVSLNSLRLRRVWLE